MHRLSLVTAGAVLVVFTVLDVVVGASDWRPLGEMGTKMPRSRIAVSLDGRHSCAVLGDGSVRCWGANAAGQLGNGAVSSGATSTPVAVTGVTIAIAVAAGRDHSCALLVTGRVQCWGANDRGQLGDGTTTASLAPVTVSNLTDAVSMSGGSRHTCVRTATGRVRCWGANGGGQLGDGTRTDRTTPVDADPLLDARMVSAGADHTCAVRANGTVVCWGANINGQLGLGDTSVRTRPSDVNGVSHVKHINAGRSVTCATVASGEVFCWGANGLGQFGNRTTTPSQTPTPAATSFSRKFSVSVGGEHACGLTISILVAANPANTGPLLECWGQNATGQLGLGTTGTPATAPQGVTSLGALMEFAAGSTHSCALMEDERVKCWGRNDAGQLGTGSTADSSLPVLSLGLAGSVTARGVAAGLNHSCAWRADGNGACWGRNASGQLGDGTLIRRLVPVAVPTDGRRLMSMAGGDHHTCFGAVTGRLSCWGRNLERQVSPFAGVAEFVTVPTSFSVRSITNLVAGLTHTMVSLPSDFVSADGAATKGWGTNDMEQLGNLVDSFTGVLVGAGPLDAPMAVATGAEHSCALLADGTVWCWGSNRFGQLGIGSTAPGPFAAPQQVLGVADAVSIANGPFHTCAVRVNGTVQCWGRNDFRQIGDATVDNRVFATDVPSIAPGGAVALALGRTHSCILTPSGGVRCWGRNDRGQLGDTTFTDRPAPVTVTMPTLLFGSEPVLSQATALTQVAGLVAGNTHTCARRVTGRPVCWGNNEDGQIGDGTTTDRRIAMSVPSFTANMVPSATVSESGRHVEITAVLSCEAGARFEVKVDLAQGDAVGQGQEQGRCTGALEQIAVKINANGPVAIDAGAATATATFEVTQGARVLDVQQWTRILDVRASQ
jgi:alpha-tubulin suppressor-like RCC1 family protein